MPKLFEITDAYTPEETIDGLPVEPVLPTERPRVIINTAEFDKPKPDPLWDDVEGFKNKVKSGVSGIGDAIKYASELDQKFTSSIVNFPKKAYENSDDLIKGIKNLFGLGEEERYQLWPEKVVKEALTSAGDIAKPNPYPEGSEQWQFYEDKRQEGMVPAAMAISALAGSGGLAGTGAKAGEVALGATPFLRPALRHKDRLYKGKLGQEHQDIIPKELYEDFSRKAMSGEDLAEYNFGFINDKGHFLDREKALKYGIDTGLIDPHSGKFGALTSTMDFAPKIEAQLIKQPAVKIGDKIYTGALGEGHGTIAANSGEVLYKNGKYDWDRISNGFLDNSGNFVSRKQAYDIASKANQIKKKSKYEKQDELHTSDKLTTLMADSSKPGMAIEAAAKTRTLIPAMKIGDKIYKGKPGDEHIDIINKNRLGLDDFEEGLGDNRFGFINHKGQFLNREKAMEYAKNNDLVKSRSKLLTSAMLLADSSKPGVAIEAIKNASPFYSAVEHTVKNIPQSKMTGEQWLGTIANKPGVKGEELDWTGLKSFLEENKGKPVTKQQIEDHIASNKVELKEVSKGAEELKIQPSKDYDGEFDVVDAKGKTRFTGSDEAEAKAYIAEEKELGGRNPTKYHSYQLPGGTNYKEMLLTLPPAKEVWDQNLIYYMRKYPQVTQEIKTLDDVALAQKHNPAFKETSKGLSPEEILATARASEKPEIIPYKSSHWDEPNILAHVRMNDRTIDGKKSLGILEVQSDWHQAGRSKGYKGTAITQAEKDEFNKLNVLPDKIRTAEQSKRLDELYGKLSAESTGVPDAPFKKTWHELAIKRMIREAAEKGYDNLHFPGSPETVAKVEGWTNFKKKTVDGKERYFTGDQDVTPIVDRYLVDFPRFLNKLGKEHGVKVEQHKFSIREKGAAPSDYSEGVLNNIDIPQSLKNTALNKGFPLFSNGYMLVPVQGNPFSDNK